MIELLGSKTGIKVLEVLFANPTTEFSESGLISRAKTGKGAASGFIDSLIKKKCLICRKAGKTKMLAINLENETIFRLRSLFVIQSLSDINHHILAEILLFREKIADLAELIIVFGSQLAGTASKDSDIDILIVSDNIGEINRSRHEVEQLFGAMINIHAYNLGEIQKSVNDSFVRNILLNGAILKGEYVAYSLLNTERKESPQKLAYLLGRIRSAIKNYIEKDYSASEEIFDNIVEQLSFFILSWKGMHYKSRNDALDSIKSLDEGKAIEKIKKSKGKLKLEKMESFLIEIYSSLIIGEKYA